MESYNIIILVFGIITLISLVLLYFINRILQYKIRIDNSFTEVRKLLDEQVNILDKMNDFLKDNLEHEVSLLKKVEKTKEIIPNIKNNSEGIKNIKRVEKGILEFTKLENTYNKLVKNKDYTNIKLSVLNNKDRLIYAFDGYDREVINYNNYRRKKLIKLLSKLCRIPQYDNYNK